MNYITSSATNVKETIRSFFSINRSLAGSIAKWVSSATVNTMLLQDHFSQQQKTVENNSQSVSK
ncbi:hypothetical protein I5907_11785 [Panacibacter sp. DH6]|uniref:Uncharacterized protein n=1 Tax=Panacibacter microcysteis TaxID=2793269 RepID=A0A931E683_9BACT|nr:hypothetical protein [Panacibacter microcysteis]MBG9376922.1 hypothetical protein [Panacibacter microcysteis]